MSTVNLNPKKTRFDIRLSKEKKMFFEKAAVLGDYRSFTDFIIKAVEEKAHEIIAEKEKIIASQRDSEIFFEAIVNASKPNHKLTNAANEYKNHLAE